MYNFSVTVLDNAMNFEEPPMLLGEALFFL